MRKLKIQFGLYFILLAVTLSFLIVHSFHQMAREERELWRGISEKVYNHFQSQISVFLTKEDQRSFYQYRFYYVPKGQSSPYDVRNRSPLSNLPINNAHGLIGYFQIDPDNSFHTPYLPHAQRWPKLDNLNKRHKLHSQLRELTNSLQITSSEEESLQKPASPAAAGYVELGRLPAPAPQKKGAPLLPAIKPASEPEMAARGTYKNIYPNPIQEQKARLEKKARISFRGAFSSSKSKDKASGSAAKKLARRKVAIAPRQLETFQAQELAEIPSSDMAKEGGAQFLSPSTAPRPIPRYAASGTSMAPSIAAPTTPSVFIDPFQARLVAQDTLIFYRKVWLNQKRYIQGFVVDLTRFFDGLMGQSFANSDLVQFSIGQLSLNNKTLASYGTLPSSAHPEFLLFGRALGYPLDRFMWQIYTTSIPHLSGRLFLYLLTIILTLLSTLGLYFIYRSVAAQMLLSQKRNDFVSAVTHELKTPLTAIRMYSEMLEDGWAKDTSKQQEYYAQINKESSRLSRLIENVLQLARLEKGTYKVDTKTESPNNDFSEIGSELTEIATHQGFILTTETEPNIPPISYDPEALKQILLILLDNSLKFAANGSDKNLAMTLKREGNTVIWTWSDRGPGIPDSEIKKVFDKFYRVENEMTRSTKGTGIGLAMAHMIMEAMEAKIQAENREDGGLEIKLIFDIH